jgi:hypothetical protein
MARYVETAGKAAKVVKEILDLVGNSPVIAAKLAKLYNLGIRSAPSKFGVQSTVRLTAVQIAMRDAPVRVSMNPSAQDLRHSGNFQRPANHAHRGGSCPRK